MTPTQKRYLAVGLLGVAGVSVIVLSKTVFKKCSTNSAPPEEVDGIPFAEGTSCPLWPLLTDRPRTVSYKTQTGDYVGNMARRFGAVRDSGRRHAGIDLFADIGDVVVATEAGTVSAIRFFYHDAWALYVCTDSGMTINYGEIKKNSYKEFGIEEGSRVEKGQPLARIGVMSGGSHMLHIETYAGCVDNNTSWYASKGPPPELLNPTNYLLRAASNQDVA